MNRDFESTRAIIDGYENAYFSIKKNFIMMILSKVCHGPHPLVSKELYGLSVPPSKAYTLLTDHLITGEPPQV